MEIYRPETLPVHTPGAQALHRGAGTGEIFQAMCVKCDEFHNLHVELDGIKGVIPREETALGVREGTAKEIAILSRVGKPVSFQVFAFDCHGTAILSRRSAQEAARAYAISTLTVGQIIRTVVQNPADFGVFCDIGCGFPALMRIDRCCISRLQSTAQRFSVGQEIYAAVLSVDPEAMQISLTGRELLGTWEENAAQFRAGQVVTGVVRSILPYGIFIELAPNLSGLAEPQDNIRIGQSVSVLIRSILPEKHKIKLNVLEALPDQRQKQLRYFITSGRLIEWEYYPGSTAFTHF